MRRIHVLLRALGPAGVVAVGILLLCVPFYFSAVRPAEMELEAQRLAAGRMHWRSSGRPVPDDSRDEALRRFYGRFPLLEELPEQLGRLYGLARTANVDLLRGEYRIEDGSGPLLAYRISLPLHGSYAQIRDFVAAALQSMPTSSIDALHFERNSADDSQIDAQVRITVHLRSRGSNEDQPE